jgi:uncharacterized hydrophobic protein (TIGR00271 family)
VLQVRVTAPRERCTALVERLHDMPAVADLVLLHGTDADGGAIDVVIFDVAREAANPVIDLVRELGVVETGSVAISEAASVLGRAAERAEEAAPGHPADGVVWEELVDRAEDDARPSWSFLAFLVLATLIAGAGRYLDQPILIIGAMVVGPEFAPLAALCVALVRRRPRIIPPALLTLLGGFAVAILVAFLLWGLANLLGLVDEVAATTGEQTEFIVNPDGWSLIVAVLAGVAGILSLTSAKSSALVGVFISITTVPAAATIALTLAVGALDEAGASAVQLGLNLAGLLVGGVATLGAQVLFGRGGHLSRRRDSRRSAPASGKRTGSPARR